MKKALFACVAILACSMLVVGSGCASKKGAKKEKASAAAVGASTYTVEKGDTLWKIAQKVYGNGAKWTMIQEANSSALKDSKTLSVGMVLSIPECK